MNAFFFAHLFCSRVGCVFVKFACVTVTEMLKFNLVSCSYALYSARSHITSFFLFFFLQLNCVKSVILN